MGRHKQMIPEMMPQKKWLSKQEAMAYLDLSINEFEKLTANLTASCITGGKKMYYKVSELDRLFEQNIIKKATA